MSKFLNSNLQSLQSYTPGEQPKDKKYIKLNTNEVLKAISKDTIKDLKLYCNPECTSLVNAFCDVFDVKPENVIFGNGSDEILDYCFYGFCSQENSVVFPDITYGFYKVFCELYGIDYKEIPLNENYQIDINDYIGIGKNIVIANPNAPTGICLSTDKIEKMVASNPDNIVVIDEAYIDFGGESCYPLTSKYDNLIVTGTFSKSRSLAGARLGFAIANEELIKDINKIKYSTNPYNINSLTQAVGTATLKDDDYYVANCKKIIENREFTVKALEELGFSVLPSSANFVVAKLEGFEGEDLYKALYDKGILIRHFKSPRIKDFLRITIGTTKEMTALINALKEVTLKWEKQL